MESLVAAREPPNFMYQCVIVIYKEGHWPVEVLEDLNMGELPTRSRDISSSCNRRHNSARGRKRRMRCESVEYG